MPTDERRATPPELCLLLALGGYRDLMLVLAGGVVAVLSFWAARR